MAYEYSQRRGDASLNPAAKTLPAAGSTTANSASIDLNAVTPFHADVEFELVTADDTATVGELPNAETLTYFVAESTDDVTFTDIYRLEEATMTGAGGAGDTANTVRFRLPSNVSRYIRVEATTSAGTGDCSGLRMTLKPRF